MGGLTYGTQVSDMIPCTPFLTLGMNSMFLFKRYHRFGYGLAVAVLSTLLLIIAGGRLAALLNAGKIGVIAVTLVLLSIGLIATGLEHRGVLVANSYISIFGKSFYVAGFVGIMHLLDPYPWYLSLLGLILVILVPVTLYPKNFFWAYGPGGDLA